MRLPKLYSYVVDHDEGFAPNPDGGLCTLAKCKYGAGRRNIVEMAEVGDWIAGTGGASLDRSAGHGKLIYAMRIGSKIALAEYCQRFRGKRIDSKRGPNDESRFALLSEHYFYFGVNAIDLSEIPRTHLRHPFEKKGPGYRADFTPDFVEDFGRWLVDTFRLGVHGRPCRPSSTEQLMGCSAAVRRKRKKNSLC